MYVDANHDLSSNSPIGECIKRHWNLLDPKCATRKGYRGQRDSKIDFFLARKPPGSKIEFKLTVEKSIPTLSDDYPLILDVFASQNEVIPIKRSRKSVVDKVKIASRSNFIF